MTGKKVSSRLSEAIEEVEGAWYAYHHDVWARAFIETLDVQWEAIVDTLVDTDVWGQPYFHACDVADRYLREMLSWYVRQARDVDRQRLRRKRILEMRARNLSRTIKIDVTD